MLIYTVIREIKGNMDFKLVPLNSFLTLKEAKSYVHLQNKYLNEKYIYFILEHKLNKEIIDAIKSNKE